MTIRDEFPRTMCACEVCQAGCRTMPGFLGVGDMSRIIDYCVPMSRDRIDVASDFIDSHFCASEGAKVARLNGNRIEMFRIPTIVPQQKENGECVFLRPDGLCGIHPVAPIGCSHCDTHMSAEDGQRVSAAALKEILSPAGGNYRAHAALLKQCGIVARPLAERKMAYARLEAEIRDKNADAAAETPQV